MSNEKKTQQLGMSFSKASGRLKKMYLLRLLQRLGEDDCFRCGGKIENVDDLSIEHKEPWLDRDVALFWDLENIAHSHLSCNSSAGRIGKQPGRTHDASCPCHGVGGRALYRVSCSCSLQEGSLQAR
jgi:hypothetical protein